MKQQILTSLCLLFLTLTSVNCDNVYSFTGTVLSNVSTYPMSYNISSQANSAAVVLNINNPSFSNLVLFADYKPISLNITSQILSSYYLNNDSILQQMDLPRVISDMGQVVNLKFPYGTTRLYLMLYNLDIPNISANKSFLIKIQLFSSSNGICYGCPAGIKFNQNCQCSPCPQDTYGLACEFSVKTIAQNQLYNATFYKMGNLYYRIVNPPETITLFFAQMYSMNSTTLYVQYQMAAGEIAGYLNSFYDSNDQAYAFPINSVTKNVTIKTRGRNLALTFACRQQINSLIKFGYGDFNTHSDALGWILGLGFGIPALIIIVLTGVFCMFCRRHNHHHNNHKNAPMNQHHLSSEQVDRYLPQVPSIIALSRTNNLQQSHHNINKQEDNEERTKNQCCICLAQIKQNERIRVGYCRHFFHSKCLISWFAKNQSCPYCRMDYNYAKTLAEYLKIKKQGPDLAGKKLVQAILSEPHKEPIEANNEEYRIQIEEKEIQLKKDRQIQKPEPERIQTRKQRLRLPIVEITPSLADLRQSEP